MTKSAICVGTALILLGLWISYAVLTSNEPWWVYLYPLGIIAVGIAMIVWWRAEDTIEERKDK